MTGVMKALTGILVLCSLIILTDGACKKTEQLTAEEKTVLEEHNKLRKKHEQTEDLCYGESGSDVTFTAASQAANRNALYSTGKTFGENIGSVGYSSGYKGKSEAYTEQVADWYSKGSDSDQHKQVIWKNTKQVNCGYGTYTGTAGTNKIFFYKVVCQYFPAGNTMAGATNIGTVADNIGALIPVPCKKPTIKNGVVKPDSATVNKGEKFTVTCNENYVLRESSNTLTCNVDGSLTPATLNCDAKPEDKNKDKDNGSVRKDLTLALVLFVTAILYYY